MMQRVAPTVETLRAALPHPESTIAQVSGLPDRIDLDIIFKFLDNFLVEIHSIKGGGEFGHLAFNMSSANYLAIGGKPFTVEKYPGELTFSAPTFNQPAREDERLVHTNQLYNWELESNVQTLGKQIIMAKLPESAYSLLRDNRLKYKKVTIYQMNQHLMLHYGDKTSEMILANENKMQAEYDCSGPSLANLFIRQNEYQLFAADTVDPIADSRWLLWTLQVIKKSGLLLKSCQKWEDELASHKTKALFITDFTTYHKAYLKRRDQEGGIASANNVQVEELQRQLDRQREEHRRATQVQTIKINEIIENQTVRDDQASLASSIPRTVSTAQTTQTAEINELKAMVNRLIEAQTNGNNGGGDNGGGDNGGGGYRRDRNRDRGYEGGGRQKGVRSFQDKRNKRKDDGRTEKRFKNKNCCHTHGWDVCDEHNSQTCLWPDKHHDATATADNFKGGCDVYKRLSHKA